LRPERSDIWVIVLLSIMNGALLLATPLAVDTLVNNIAFGGQEGVYLQALLVLSLALFAFLVLVAVMRAAQHYVMEIIQRRLFVRLAADLAYRLPRLEVSALERAVAPPELVNRFFEIVTVQKSSSLLLLEGVNLALSTLMGLIILGFYHPFLLAFDLVLVAFLGFILWGMGRNAVATSIRESYAKHAVAGWLEQLALFPILFRSEGGSDLACRRADALAVEYLGARRAHFRILLRQIVGLLGLQALASAALLTIGGALVLRGELTLGQLVASELIVGAIVASVAKFGKHLEAWYDILASVDKLAHVVDLPIERSAGEAPRMAASAEVRGQQVSFAYPSGPPVFDGLSFAVASGSRTAIVGSAGSGTSTLFDLLYGLRLPQQGMILVDGVDLRHWPPAALRLDVALVRGCEIAEGTIAENVRLGREQISLEEVRRALEAVGLMNAVLQFPDGLDTRLKPGGSPLSKTQRTQLVIARAIIGRPRLLLLDETLEGLDAITLSDLERCLFDRANPWTLIVATRSADLIAHCDQVLRLGEKETAPEEAR
jgi:ABC-type bacteriocin/lantibiotic exporter with double-glycine peptidase domain